jgi:hypothetical protein
LINEKTGELKSVYNIITDFPLSDDEFLPEESVRQNLPLLTYDINEKVQMYGAKPIKRLSRMEINQIRFLSYFESLFPNQMELYNSKYAKAYITITKLIVLNKMSQFTINLEDISDFNNLFDQGSPIIISKSCNRFCKDTTFVNDKNPELNTRNQSQFDAIYTAQHPEQYVHIRKNVESRHLLKEYLDQYELLPGELEIIVNPLVNSYIPSHNKAKLKLTTVSEPIPKRTTKRTTKPLTKRSITRANYINKRKKTLRIRSIP